MIGTQVDHYEFVERIAGGGMGEVYRAVDLELDRDVAIKCVRPELSDLEDIAKRFRTEARTLAKLSHLNIATVFRFFAEDERLFLVMEYIKGRAFGDLVKSKAAMEPDRAVALVTEALKGLGYAHTHKVVHRDIKPGNLMLDDAETVKVLDFGIAHLIGGTRVTRAGSVVGTPAYMAPEQILGKDVDPRTDLYSIGIVLYELLSGSLPYPGNSDFELMRAHVEEVPRPLGDLADNNVSKELQETVSKALAKDVDDRFQSAEEFVKALEDTVGGETAVRPIPAAVAPTVQAESLGEVLKPVATELKRRIAFKQILFASGFAALVVFIIAAILWPSARETQSPASAPIASAPATTSDSAPAGGTEPLIPRGTSATSDVAGTATPSGPGAASANVSSSSSTPGSGLLTGSSGGGGSNVVSSSAVGSSSGSASGASSPPPAATQPVVTQPARPKPAARPTPVFRNDPKVRAVKVSVHERQGLGRFSRDAGYNGSFQLSISQGSARNFDIDEIIEIRRDGQRIRRDVLDTAARTPGTFKSKRRIPGLKTLEPGEYEMRLVFEHKGRTVGTHEWRLTVGG